MFIGPLHIKIVGKRECGPLRKKGAFWTFGGLSYLIYGLLPEPESDLSQTESPILQQRPTHGVISHRHMHAHNISVSLWTDQVKLIERMDRWILTRVFVWSYDSGAFPDGY